ncbi:MAG TPA: sigma-70 family RNA polymerase sigma factor [Gemmataceae bacterium]|jgi:RNA polymerase sigma-70 factor (ECF subfamily)|nr:sigma-70 family RNA polymerase sigma factor [Gemmataceae bacterium]
MWPEPQQVQKLLAEAGKGRPQAEEELLGLFREPLRRVVELRLDPQLARREDASDIVQKVLFDAHRRLAEYLKEPRMPFHLWLRHMAQDRIIDTYRRHKQAARRSIDHEQPQQPPAWASQSSVQLLGQLMDRERTPASAVLQQELQQKLQEVLQRLDDTDREVILMRYYEHLSNQEIATALGLTEAAASMRHLRALRRLKEALTG